MNKNSIHSKLEKIIITVLSFIAVVCNLILIFSYYYDVYYTKHFSHVYHSFRFEDIHYEALIVNWFCIVILFVFAIKGFYKTYTKRIKYYFYPLSIPFFILYISMFYPFFIHPLDRKIWIFLELFGIVLLFVYLVNILVEDHVKITNEDIVDKNLHARFTRRNKLTLLILAAICINCYILLTIYLFSDFSYNFFSVINAPAVPYAEKFKNPAYDISWILMLSQAGILCILIKGLYLGFRRKLSHRNLSIIIRIAALIFYFIYYLPNMYFPVSLMDSQIVHFFGIILMISIIYLSRDYIETPKDLTKLSIGVFQNDQSGLKKIEALLLSITVYVSCACLLFLSLIDSIAEIYSDHFIYKTSHTYSLLSPVYDISWILLICLFILLYFIIKGLWLGKRRKSLCICIFNVASLLLTIVLILLYGPYIYYSGLSIFGWQIVHFIGIIFLLIILANREKYFGIKTKVLNTTLDLVAFEKDSRRYTRRDLMWIATFSLICILGIGVSIILRILFTFGKMDIAYVFENFNIINPYFDMWVAIYGSILGIFYLTIKGIRVGFKKDLNKIFSLWLPVMVICMIVFCPFFSFDIKSVLWTVSDILGLGLFITFLNTVVMEN
ncbi:MAG TPA: hypothetical protein QF753_04325 [Victivallales bacterium]|nr:hypothetical protein [Victivallales bacterium]